MLVHCFESQSQYLMTEVCLLHSSAANFDGATKCNINDSMQHGL